MLPLLIQWKKLKWYIPVQVPFFSYNVIMYRWCQLSSFKTDILVMPQILLILIQMKGRENILLR